MIERDAQANGASIRNFGFVTVTGQQRGECWRRAMRSRDVWAEVAPARRHPRRASRPRRGGAPARGGGRAGGVPRDRDGRRLRAAVGPRGGRALPDAARETALRAVLWSPHELRVESRTAIPALARWLAEAHGVDFLLRDARARGRRRPRSRPARGTLQAARCVVCPGDDFLAPLSRALRRLRPHPLQAAHAARRRRHRRCRASRRR